jgi:transposase
MAKGYSTDMRVRAIELVEEGESAREAARILGVGASSTIRWVDRWTSTGSVAAKPGTGHCRSPLEAYKDWLIDLVSVEPDLTLEEIRARLAEKQKHKAGLGSICRFYKRHKISFKKNSSRDRAGSS